MGAQGGYGPPWSESKTKKEKEKKKAGGWSKPLHITNP